jgi:hypothetical protein
VRFAVNFDQLLWQVDDPDLGNACAAVSRQLVVAIIHQSTIRYFNQQKHIRRFWMAYGIMILNGF